MSYFSVAIGGGTAIMSAIQAGKARKEKKKIAREIANQKEVPLTNIADTMQVSTRSSDLQKEEQGRLAATAVGTLADGGSHALVGGVGQIAASNQKMAQQIGANLDEQQNDINNVRAQDSGRIQNTREQRQQAKLNALNSQYAGAQDAQAQAMGNMMMGAGMAGGALAGSGKLAAKPYSEPVGIENPSQASATRGNLNRAFGKGATIPAKKKYDFAQMGAGIGPTRPKNG